MKIGTHDGRFHADEVLACAVLKLIFEDLEIIRTRDSKILEGCDIVVDVGEVYNPNLNLFDHHQLGCNETFKHSTIPLSSAGMVYKHYGKKLIVSVIGNINKDVLENVYNELYFKMFQEVDANDNGVPITNDDVKYNYRQYLHYGQIINSLNGNDVSNDEDQNIRFNTAVEFAMTVLEIQLRSIYESQSIYNGELENFIADLEKSRSPVLVLTRNYSNWQKYLSDFTKGTIGDCDADQFKFTVYPKNSEKTVWGFSTIQKERFKNEIDLLSEQILKEKMDVPEDLIFVHKNLFCGSAKSLDSAIECCELSYYQKIEPKSNKFTYSLFFGAVVLGYLFRYFKN